MSRRVPLTLLIAGDGEERDRLRSRARNLGLDPARIRFLGHRDDVPDLLGACDLFVLPSHTEGLPLSVLEAMSHGLPVVATAVGGVPEALGDTGLLAPARDAGALAERMERLARAPELRRRLGDAARRRALEEFSFASMAARYEALYRALLRRAAGTGP
jgi:glycosyltransferase involved in cell wall biosynthesis